MRFFYEEHGEGFPIILLHAFPLDRSMWHMQTEALISAGFRVILPDLGGFGENNIFSDPNTMENSASEILALLDHLNIERAVIGGLSMGGYVSFNLYRIAPERFESLLLFDTTPTADTPEKREARFDLIKNIEAEGSQTLSKKMLPNLVSEQTKKENPELYANLEERFRKVNPKAAIAALRGMASRLDHTYLLEKIEVPTLLIFGEEDRVTNLDAAKLLNSRIPSSELQIIPGAGHFSNLEAPETFNRFLLEFLLKHEFKR
jgi:Predicted hydrolases or acyltransferases (alpha/beta hydrolase superfamily)